MDLPVAVNLHNLLLAILEYLHQNILSVKVIKNYLSSITSAAKSHNMDYSATNHGAVFRYIRGLSLTLSFRPTPPPPPPPPVNFLTF